MGSGALPLAITTKSFKRTLWMRRVRTPGASFTAGIMGIRVSCLARTAVEETVRQARVAETGDRLGVACG